MAKYKVVIRKNPGGAGPEAEQIDGNVYEFQLGWVLEESDTSIYIGETAMVPDDPSYPKTAPSWVASGDLKPV
jgi:hypothetical protein